MNLQNDPGAMFRTVLPEAPPPPAELDLDQIVRDGYRARRRHRALLGGAATTGVMAVAGLLVIGVVGLPIGEADPAENRTVQADPPAAESIEDLSMAGYPYDHAWEYPEDPETNAIVAPEEAQAVGADATEAFGQLLADAGIWADPVNTNDTGECEYFAEAGQNVEECDDVETGLHVSPLQRPGNYGQTYLRSYTGGAAEEAGDELRTTFNVEVLWPGGWTPEPGPITDQLFPQHLISDGAYYTDEAPDFETSTLDDGRTLMTADHGCAYDIAVVYPNGTGLRVTWDVDCGDGDPHPVELADLTDAALAMPQYEFDTSTLEAVDELIDVPTGWVDDTGWEYTPEAIDGAAASVIGAAEALEQVYPEATLGDPSARTLGITGRGLVTTRSYHGYGTLPYETTIDEMTGPVNFELRYYLPGGWVPGINQFLDRGPSLAGCTETATCEYWEGPDGLSWASESVVTTYEPGAGETWEAYTDNVLELHMFHPDGWAASIHVSWTGDTPIDADMIGQILVAMPAPVYDEDEVPEIPAG
ncbi:hypothetical protein [Glycomyces niveus]|uniref:Uncharacterized protein n=1 Tax=Glycomyces niveus TaxID=2820287 RepID=A0ABS3U303_9ACTN|nr:hypothetical protein [Glycomyces sp. NEAU-S30]MBO3732631.1 hypothetical protein [Glycomyces sp. NEAU-S30]